MYTVAQVTGRPVLEVLRSSYRDSNANAVYQSHLAFSGPML